LTTLRAGRSPRSSLARSTRTRSITSRPYLATRWNREWQVGLGICRWWQAQLEAVTLDAKAESEARDAERIFAAAHADEPKDQWVLKWLARTYNLQSQLALAGGRTAEASERSAMASELLEPQRNHPDESTRIVLADTLLLAGETAQRTGDLSAARAAWQRAQELLLADATNPLPFSRLEPLVRALQHLDLEPQAQPHRERLATAGYVPLRSFETSATALTRR
jgi:hypothetical protein